jgi:chemotaxis methyl-accepting protein methylase/mannose-6-phosphate isomerase-like protein (cupin superfamily)
MLTRQGPKSMNYVHSLPAEMAFDTKGLFGYSFGPMRQKELEIYYIVVETGHDTFLVSKKITRMYYVLAGTGSFTIAGNDHDVRAGMLVEIPPKVEFSYSGKMTLLGISNPRWFAGNDTVTRWNPAVVPGELPETGDEPSRLKRCVGFRLFGKSPVGAFLRLNQRLWKMLPERLVALRPFRSYGDLLHALARVQGVRAQAFSTFFLRNRPQLELIRRLIACRARGSTLNVAVLGCSTGPEAYSVAWAIRTGRPDLRLVLHAFDISRQAIQIAKRGSYRVVTAELTPSELFDRMSDREIKEMFDIENDVATVKAWLREGIEWVVGDVGDLKISERRGSVYDIVTANNFLCHMDAAMAGHALRNISRLVSCHGYLFVSGVDLEVRTRISAELGWEPLEELLEEIHDGDPCMKNIWPCHYGGLEPLNKERPDWRRRYAAAFRLIRTGGEAGKAEQPSLDEDNGEGGSLGRTVPAPAFAADGAVRVAAAR